MSDLTLMPYLVLLASVVLCWTAPIKWSLVCFSVAVVVALLFQRVHTLGLVWLMASGGSLWAVTRFSSWGKLRWLGYGIFLVLAVALSLHLLPGFGNLLVFDNVRFSFDSRPFSMYLNFDKTAVGIFIFLFFLRGRDQNAALWTSFTLSLKVLGLLCAVMIPLSVAMGYVRFEPKFPPGSWIWILNNLFYVTFSEEALFRGFILGGLANVLPKSNFGKWTPLVVSSLIFGGVHYRGGLAYVFLASVAGIFYGYTYLTTRRLEGPMLVHFGFNFTHFLLFSYPSLQP